MQFQAGAGLKNHVSGSALRREHFSVCQDDARLCGRVTEWQYYHLGRPPRGSGGPWGSARTVRATATTAAVWPEGVRERRKGRGHKLGCEHTHRNTGQSPNTPNKSSN